MDDQVVEICAGAASIKLRAMSAERSGIYLVIPLMLIAVISIRSNAFCAADERLIAASAVNLRDGPSHSSEIIMQLPYGTIFRVESQIDDWIRVSLRDFPAIRGFVHKTTVLGVKSPIPERDQETIRQFKRGLVAPNSFVDWARHTDDLLPDTPPDVLLVSMLKNQHENLERWLYWDKESVPIKYRIWVLRLLGERLSRYGGVYGKTPVEVMNASRVYNVPAFSYKLTTDPVCYNHELEMPRPRPSYFSELPSKLLVVHATKTSGVVAVQDYRLDENTKPPFGAFLDERVLIIHLLKTYFDNTHAFRIVRRGDILYWESQDMVPVAVCDMSGNDLRIVRTRIQYELGRGIILLPDVEYKVPEMLLFFGQPSMIDRIARQGRFIVNVRPEKKRFITRVEVDFDRDGTVDMIRTVALTHDGVEDPLGNFDLVFYFNVAGNWQMVLGQRVKLVP